MKTQVLDNIDALAFGDEATKEKAYDYLYQFVNSLNI
jgi:hypothetical protein